jgi:hypothetical protein
MWLYIILGILDKITIRNWDEVLSSSSDCAKFLPHQACLVLLRAEPYVIRQRSHVKGDGLR